MPNSLSELHTLHAWEDNQITERCTQGEYAGKVLQFKLVDKDGAINLSNCLVQYAVTRPDKIEDLLDCTVDNGVVKCNLTYSVTSVVGLVHGEVRVIGSNDSGIIKFYGVNLRVYKGVSDEVAEQSDEFTALVAALRKVVALDTSDVVAEMDDLNNGNLPNGTNPVASGNLKTFLEGNFQTYLKNRYMSFKYAHVAHSNTYNADTNPVDSYNDSPFEGVYIDEATDPMTFYIIKGGNGVQTGILLCAKAVGSSNNGVTQIALYYHGGFQYRHKSNSINEWTEWAGIEIQTNRDVYNSADSKYYGVTNNSSRYPSSKMIYRLINKVYSLFKDSVVLNYDGLETDITFNIHSDLVETYLNDSDYSNDLDYSISKLDDSSFNSYKSNADFKFSNEESHGRPNKEIIPVPSGGVKIVYKDTVSGLEWSESVTSSITYIQNLIPNRIYTYKVLSTDGTVLNSGTAKATGKVRMINAGGQTYNIRDIGGWAADGGILRYGVIYRGAELNGDNVSIDANQQAFFKNILGIRDEIDLRENNRNGIGNTALGIGVDYLHVPIIYPPNFLINDLDRCSKVIKRIAKDISENKPIYIHCGAGADRTGVTCFLIEAMCGVSQNDIDRDYELTSFSTQPADSNNVETLIRARNSSWGYGLKQWISTINNHQSMDGSSFHDKVIRILLRAGVTIDEINTIRFGLIEGNPTKLSNPYSNVTITKSLTRVSIDNTDTSIAMYQPYEATLIASNTNYFDSNSVSITMNGNPNFSYSFINLKTTCKIKIPKVLGDIVITAVASPTTYLSNVSTNNIDNDAITTEKIVNGAVTENKLSFTAVKYIVAATLPSVDNANADTDYYIGTLANGYTHYRLIDNRFIPLGNDSYTKSEIDAIQTENDKRFELQTTVGFDENGIPVFTSNNTSFSAGACSVESVKTLFIASNVTTISSGAFNTTANQNITTVYIDNEQTDITIQSSAFPSGATIYYKGQFNALGFVIAALKNLSTSKLDDTNNSVKTNHIANLNVTEGKLSSELQTKINRTTGVYSYTISASNWSNNAQSLNLSSVYTVTSKTKVDIEGDDTVLGQLVIDDCDGIYVENNNGSLTIKAITNAPTENITVQLVIYEVEDLN